MSDTNLKLFKDDGLNISMPSINSNLATENKELISESIDRAILEKQVKTLLLPETTKINTPNYVLDVTNCDSLARIQMQVLHKLLSKEGDVNIYIYKGTKGLYFCGLADKYKLERIMPLIQKYVFEDKISIYKDFEIGAPVHTIKSKDITQMRINL